jgi:hypothetical protein
MGMINGIHNPNELRNGYEAARPFAHIVLDGFLVPSLEMRSQRT